MQLRQGFRERWRQQFAGFSLRLGCAVLLWYRWKADEIHQTCQETNHRRDTVWRHHGRDETRRLWSHIAKLCCVHLEHEQIVPFVTTSLSNGIHLGPAYALTLVLSLTILHTLMFNSNSKSNEKEKRHQQKAFFPFCWREVRKTKGKLQLRSNDDIWHQADVLFSNYEFCMNTHWEHEPLLPLPVLSIS